MTNQELDNLIIKKEREVLKWANLATKNLLWVYVFCLVYGIGMTVVGFVYNPMIMLSFLGIPFTIFAIVMLIIYTSRKKKAPRVLEMVKQQLEELKAQKANNAVKQEEQKSSSNINDLLKYKELLDAGVITQEEFNAKKKELL